MKKAHSILFAKIADMRIIIFQILGCFYDGEFDKIFQDYAIRSIYRTKNLSKHMEVFKNSGMEKESEELINAFWNIHRECAQQAFPEAYIYGWDFDYKDDGWEKFLQLQTTHPNQTFENYIKGNSKT